MDAFRDGRGTIAYLVRKHGVRQRVVRFWLQGACGCVRPCTKVPE